MILVFIWVQELRYQIGAFQWITKWSWPIVKMSITTAVYLRRGPSGPNPKPTGPRGRSTGPTPCPAGQGLRWLGPGLGWHVSTSVHKEGSEAQRPWRPRWVADHPRGWLAGRPFALNQPCQVGGDSPLPLYKPPLWLKSQHPTLHVKVRFSSSSIGEALSGVESWVEHSLELWK
jgi:hypothetical protein